MSVVQVRLLSYTDVRDLQRTHPLRQTEIPVEHSVSLPLPTKRWLGPAYAFFASPAVRRPGQPVEQGPPDRWWVIGAHGGRIIVYALWKAIPYAEGVDWATVTLPPVSAGIEELRQALKRIDELMNALAPLFFAGEEGDAGLRRELAEALASQLPEPLRPQYRALATDFFAWLEA